MALVFTGNDISWSHQQMSLVYGKTLPMLKKQKDEFSRLNRKNRDYYLRNISLQAVLSSYKLLKQYVLNNKDNVLVAKTHEKR